MKPITPAQLTKSANHIPGEVFEVVNRLIQEKFSDSGNFATIHEDDIIRALIGDCLTRQKVFETGWLNFENAYRRAGWEVKYEKPCFTFKPKKGRHARF